jgi:hypothetical protein
LSVVGNITATGSLTITATSSLNGTIVAGGLTGSNSRMAEISSTGIVSAGSPIISAYIVSGGTVANLLEDTANWDIDGIYIGTTITGTYQGQKHYNSGYFFEAIADNVFIRLIRG